MLPTSHGTYSRKEQSEREGEVGKSGRNSIWFLRREHREHLPQMQGYLCPMVPWASPSLSVSTPWHRNTDLPPPAHPQLRRLSFLGFPSTPSSPGKTCLPSFACLARCSEPSSASGDAVITRGEPALPSQNLKSERDRGIFKRKNGINVVRLLQIRSPGSFLLANLRRFYRSDIETGWWGMARI